jgi:hypothetical protein
MCATCMEPITSDLEEIFTELFSERETHLRRFFNSRRGDMKKNTIYVVGGILELEGDEPQKMIALKYLKNLLCPKYIPNETSLYRLLNDMEHALLLSKVTRKEEYKRSRPGKQKMDTFYLLSPIAFVNVMSRDKARKIENELHNSAWKQMWHMGELLNISEDLLREKGVENPHSIILERFEKKKTGENQERNKREFHQMKKSGV